MFHIVFVTFFVLLFAEKSQAVLNVYELPTIIKFAQDLVNTEEQFLDSAGNDHDKDISDTLGRMNKTEKELETFVKTLGTIEFFFLLFDLLRPVMNSDDSFVFLFEEIDDYLYEIHKLYETYAKISNKSIQIDHGLAKRWIDTTSSKDDGLPKMLKELYTKVILPESKLNNSVFHKLAAKLLLMGPESDCGYRLSIQQRLHLFYQVFMLNQLQGFVMNVYGNTLKNIIDKTTDKSAYAKAEAQVVLSIAEYMKASKLAMSDIPRYVETCDSAFKIPNVTYASFNGLLQEIIISEQDISPQKDCYHNCDSFSNVRTRSCTEKAQYCPSRPCRGHLDQCSKINNEVTMCELTTGFGRRYDWYRIAGNYKGAPSSCVPTDSSGHIRHGKVYLGKGGQCDMCVCVCTEDEKDSTAIRAVSFLPQIAAIEDNMVLAGIRIIQADGLIQMQIKQGKIMSEGRIDVSTVSWINTAKMRYNANVTDGSFDIYDEKTSTWREMQQRTEYSFIGSNGRGGNLDEINIDDNYVITGARWNTLPNQKEIFLQIEVHTTKYDYQTGKLDPNDSKWVTPQNMAKRPAQYNSERKMISTWQLGSPLHSPSNLRSSHPNQWFHFHATSSDDDAGQNTIPFFDTQAVETYLPLASIGIDFMYRNSPSYAGYLALRLIAVDLSKVWTVDIDRSLAIKYHPDFSGTIMFTA